MHDPVPLSFSLTRRPPRSPLFPYTTLFRSERAVRERERDRIRRAPAHEALVGLTQDRKSTRLNSSHGYISYAVFCLKKKKTRYTAPSTADGDTTKQTSLPAPPKQFTSTCCD